MTNFSFGCFMKFHRRCLSTSSIPCCKKVKKLDQKFKSGGDGKGGGVCVFLSEQVYGKRRLDLEEDDLELLWIEIKHRSHPPLLVGCCYRPPSSTMNFYNTLELTLDKIAERNVILVGDFNAKHRDWFSGDATNSHGATLKDLMSRFDMVQTCSEPTHLNNDGVPESLLDLVFTNSPNFVNATHVLPPISSSDHLPVLVQCSFSSQIDCKNQTVGSRRLKWLYHRKNKDRMSEAFLYDNWSHVFTHDPDGDDIDKIWEKWKDQFFKEIRTFIPCLTVSGQSSKSSCRSPPWFNKEILQIVRTKNRLFKRACRSNKPVHWEVYRRARNHSNTAIRRAKSFYFHQEASLLADPNCSPSTWWRVARKLCDLKGTPHVDMPPLLASSQKIVGSDSGKAELLNDTFINSNASLNQDAFPVCPSILSSVFTFDNICASDVSRALRSLPAKRSSGSDEIPYQLLKEAGPGIVGPLTTLFNKSLNVQQVPLEWKNAVVIPIYKGGRKDRQNPTSYRPISLTSCVARLMEKLLNSQILRYLQSHSLIFQHQSGFLPNHSTVTQLCFLVQKWQMAIDNGEHVQAAFLDLSKAYDRVGIPGLIGKLSALGFSRSSLSWLRSFLTNRKQCVCVNGFKSSWQSPKSGIPQGTVLGPVLFLTFINDLPQSLTCECSIFADDSTAYTAGKDTQLTCRKLSLNLDYASDWASSWGMLFSAEKSEHLQIAPKTQNLDQSDGDVFMHGSYIPRVTTHKHLGVHINSRLSWQDHIDHVYTDCARKIGILRRLQRKLGSRALRKIFIGAIRPRLEYACPVWSGGNTSKLVKLQELFCCRHQIVLPQLQQRFDYHTLVLFFKIKSNLAPPYLTKLLPQLSSHCGYNFRKNLYPVPAVKKSSTLTSFFPRSIILWNSLPSDIQSSTSLPKFKAVLRAYLKV